MCGGKGIDGSGHCSECKLQSSFIRDQLIAKAAPYAIEYAKSTHIHLIQTSSLPSPASPLRTADQKGDLIHPESAIAQDLKNRGLQHKPLTCGRSRGMRSKQHHGFAVTILFSHIF